MATESGSEKRGLDASVSRKRGIDEDGGVSLDRENLQQSTAVAFYEGLYNRWKNASTYNQFEEILNRVPYLDDNWSAKRNELLALLDYLKNPTDAEPHPLVLLQHGHDINALDHCQQEINGIKSKISKFKTLLENPNRSEQDVVDAVKKNYVTLKLLSQLDDGFVSKLLEDEIMQLHEKLKQLLEKLKHQFERYLSDVKDATKNTNVILSSISGFNQANVSVYGTTTRIAIDAAKSANIPPPFVRSAPKPAAEGDLYGTVMAQAKNNLLDTVLKLPLDFQQDVMKRLGRVSAVINLVFMEAQFINSKAIKKQKKDLIKTTIIAVTKHIADEENNMNKKFASSLHVPGTDSDEVDCVQPWLFSVLDLVGRCLPAFTAKKNERMTKSPTKKDRIKEVRTEPVDGRHNRANDIMLGAERLFNKVNVDDAIQVPGEMKPEARSRTSPEVLHHQGDDQGLASAAKSITIPFNFNGIGLESRSTYLVLTPAFIQVNQLRTVNVGTPKAEVKLFRSKKYPFLTLAGFNRYVAKNESKFKTLRGELYGDNSDVGDQPNQDGQPTMGFKILASVMMSPRDQLYGPCIPTEDDTIGSFLGSGTFSMVFLYKKDPSCVVKLSRYGREISDAQVLSKLPEDQPDTIVKLIEELQTNVMIGGFQVSLPAVILTPVGRPLLSELPAENGDVEHLAEMVYKDMTEALNYLHENNLLHRDVKPSNILIIGDGENRKAVLTDFNVAGALDLSTVVGFIGTRNYAHRDVFTFFPGKKYRGHIRFDFIGLGYTLTVLLNHGQMPWNPIINYPQKLSTENKNGLLECMNDRLNDAKNSLMPPQEKTGIFARLFGHRTEKEGHTGIAQKVIKLLDENDGTTLNSTTTSRRQRQRQRRA